MSIDKNKITGIILAGGQSRRFGTDKARAIINPLNQPLIVNLFQLLENLDLNPMIVADRNDKYQDLGLNCEIDIIPNKGPLGGIYTALNLAPTNKVLILTCDMPYIGIGVLRKLLILGKKSEHGVVYGKDSTLHPFPGVYTTNHLPIVKNCLQNDQLEIIKLLWQLPNLLVVPFNLDTNDFFNMNTVDDYKFINQNQTSS